MSEGQETDIIYMLKLLQNTIDNSHLMLKYVMETYKTDKSLDYAMPAIECHVAVLDRMAGTAEMDRAIEMVKVTLNHIEGKHHEH